MLTYSWLQVAVILAGFVVGMFVIIEIRIHQNNKNIEALLDRKDEVIKMILHRMTDEIFDGRELLEARINILEKHSENE